MGKFVRKQKIILIKCILKEYVMRSICVGQLPNEIRDTKLNLLYTRKNGWGLQKPTHLILEQKNISAASFRLEENSEKVLLSSL